MGSNEMELAVDGVMLRDRNGDKVTLDRGLLVLRVRFVVADRISPPIAIAVAIDRPDKEGLHRSTIIEAEPLICNPAPPANQPPSD